MSLFQGSRDLQTFYKTNPISFAMIILVTIGFILQNFLKIYGIDLVALGALKTFDYEIIIINGERYAANWQLNQEFYRFVSAIFLHGDFLHFAFNTFFGFFIIGAGLERTIGPKKYLLTIVITGLGASAVVYGWNWVLFLQTTNTKYLVPTIGASGVIYGTMGFLLYLTMVRSHWFMPQDIQSIRGLILINVIFTILVPNISLPGHFGGLLMGILVGKFLASEEPYQRIPKGFGNPYDPYYHEKWRVDDLEDVEIVEDDDDDDDRRYW